MIRASVAIIAVFVAQVAAAQKAPAKKPAPPAKQPTAAAKKPAVAARPGSRLDVAKPGGDTASAPPTILREVYAYSRDGRRDPFVSLLTTNELRPAISDLRLTTIAFDPGGQHSLAILRDIGTNAQYRVTEGSTLGRMHVSAIRPKTVVFIIDEFGTTRRDSLMLGDSTKVRGS
ncbi:MAG TPA: hypothetical protein VGM67_00470 [Gemmatimonadaceae bacterium]|jgi:hypothetical protein